MGGKESNGVMYRRFLNFFLFSLTCEGFDLCVYLQWVDSIVRGGHPIQSWNVLQIEGFNCC